MLAFKKSNKVSQQNINFDQKRILYKYTRYIVSGTIILCGCIFEFVHFTFMTVG